MRATQVVHWPGQDSPACDAHAEKLKRLAAHMGFSVASSPTSLLVRGEEPGEVLVVGTPEVECANCANEARRKST